MNCWIGSWQARSGHSSDSRGCASCITIQPVRQPSLASIPTTHGALRFELYCQGIELANGFEELADAGQQRARFELDRQQRRAGLPAPAIDEALLAALAAGLPPVSGVALGFDRLLMLRLGATAIEQVLPFPLDRA